MSSPDQQQQYDEYIARKHAEMQTHVTLLNQFVHKATGHNIKDQKRLMLGEANEVYDIKTTEDEDIIMRISHDKYATFGKEGLGNRTV